MCVPLCFCRTYTKSILALLLLPPGVPPWQTCWVASQPSSDGASGCQGGPPGKGSALGAFVVVELWDLRPLGFALCREGLRSWARIVWRGCLPGLCWAIQLFRGRQKSCLHPRSSHPKTGLPGRTKRLQKWTLSIVRPVNVKLPALPTASHWGQWPPSSSPWQWKSLVSETRDVSLVGIQAWGLAKQCGFYQGTQGCPSPWSKMGCNAGFEGKRVCILLLARPSGRSFHPWLPTLQFLAGIYQPCGQPCHDPSTTFPLFRAAPPLPLRPFERGSALVCRINI